MLREVRKYLFDILEACKLLDRFVSGKTFEDYDFDPMFQSAVERKFEIIGEALNKALKYDPSLADKISDTRRIIGLRNKLIHGYESIANDIIWGIVETNLPILLTEIESQLNEPNNM